MKRIYSAIGKIASLYDIALRLTGYEKSVRFFVSKLPFDQGEAIQVLDAGCGTGLYTFAVLDRYPNAHVTAFDSEKGLVTRLQQKAFEKGYRGRVHVFVADITGDLQQLQTTFDLIITAGVLEYVPLKPTVANLSRFLRDGGYFFNSPLRTTVWGNIVARLYGCKSYTREENVAAFEPRYELDGVITLPSFRPSSFKEGHLFRNIDDR